MVTLEGHPTRCRTPNTKYYVPKIVHYLVSYVYGHTNMVTLPIFRPHKENAPSTRGLQLVDPRLRLRRLRAKPQSIFVQEDSSSEMVEGSQTPSTPLGQPARTYTRTSVVRQACTTLGPTRQQCLLHLNSGIVEATWNVCKLLTPGTITVGSLTRWVCSGICNENIVRIPFR